MRFHHVEGHLGYDRDGLLPAIDIELTPPVNRAGLRWNASGRYRQLYDKQYNFERDRFINPGEDFTPEPDEGGVAVPPITPPTRL